MVILSAERFSGIFGRDAVCKDIMYSLDVERLFDLGVRSDKNMDTN